MRNLLCLLALVAVSACTQDAYEKGEGVYSEMTAQLADAHVNSDKRVDYVDTDEGERLMLSKSASAGFITKADTTYRVSFYESKGHQGDEDGSREGGKHVDRKVQEILECGTLLDDGHYRS